MNAKKTERKLIAMSKEEVVAVEDWRRTFVEIPSWSEAARQLISKGLNAYALAESESAS